MGVTPRVGSIPTFGTSNSLFCKHFANHYPQHLRTDALHTRDRGAAELRSLIVVLVGHKSCHKASKREEDKMMGYSIGGLLVLILVILGILYLVRRV